MTGTSSQSDEELWYEIRVKGHLHNRWAAWLDGLELSQSEDGTTLLRGQVADQAALHGVLNKLGDIGLPLVSVEQVDPGRPQSTIHATATDRRST